ncbi:MAG: heat-inducible transcription repressor HrcA [candidate division Zixibacteria bacterium]|nr:heat-inducible transcription repressor HrcA [candidate division Zixibacteria bacterium]
MAFENLSEREQKVLACLISHYISSADPVGSRAIANKYRLGISPATIRNTMQDLEELGLVLQPHTSAGRVPTDAGYRLFVDRLLGSEEITDSERKTIEEGISSHYGGVDAILGQTSRVLAELSNQLGITISPKMDNSVLSRIELMQLADSKVLVVLAFHSGLARTILVEVEATIGLHDLINMSQVLNEKLAGLTLGHIRKTIQERLANTTGSPRLLRFFIDNESDVWNNLAMDQLHIEGAENLVVKPEFSDKEKLQEIIRLINSPIGLIEDIRGIDSPDSGIVITIGAENKAQEIQSCSVVSASYEAGNTRGTIGVIGPTRMPYAKLASLVKTAARQLSRVLKTGRQ